MQVSMVSRKLLICIVVTEELTNVVSERIRFHAFISYEMKLASVHGLTESKESYLDFRTC